MNYLHGKWDGMFPAINWTFVRTSRKKQEKDHRAGPRWSDPARIKGAAERLERTGTRIISHFGYQQIANAALIVLPAFSRVALKFLYLALKWSNLSQHRTSCPCATTCLPSFSCFPEFYLLSTRRNSGNGCAESQVKGNGVKTPRCLHVETPRLTVLS